MQLSPTVIASEAKQSMRHRAPARMDCFVASLLAMTENTIRNSKEDK